MDQSSKQPEMTKTIIDPETRRRRTVPASMADELTKQRFEKELAQAQAEQGGNEEPPETNDGGEEEASE